METGGNGSTDVCEIGWQDVISEDGLNWHVNEERSVLSGKILHLAFHAYPEALRNWQFSAHPLSSVFVPRNRRSARIGSAFGNAFSEYGWKTHGSPIGCF